MPRDERPRYVETEAGTLETPRQAAVELNERFEDAVEVRLRNTDPGIAHKECQTTVSAERGAYRHRAVPLE